MSMQGSTAPGATPAAHDESDNRRRRNAAVVHLLEEWLADESGYDEETWDDLKAALKENRRTSRDLFRD
jgi:hypothetical protein